jgi:branched-chain amino acid transport system permease protein
MVILGGMGTLRGAALGAFVLIVLPESLRFLGFPMSIFAPLRQILYGATLVVLMMYRPSGLIGTYRWTQ